MNPGFGFNFRKNLYGIENASQSGGYAVTRDLIELRMRCSGSAWSGLLR